MSSSNSCPFQNLEKEVETTTVVDFYINKHDAFKLFYYHDYKSSVYMLMQVCTVNKHIRKLLCTVIKSSIHLSLSPRNISYLPLVLWRIFHNYGERMRASFARKKGRCHQIVLQKSRYFHQDLHADLANAIFLRISAMLSWSHK